MINQTRVRSWCLFCDSFLYILSYGYYLYVYSNFQGRNSQIEKFYQTIFSIHYCILYSIIPNKCSQFFIVGSNRQRFWSIWRCRCRYARICWCIYIFSQIYRSIVYSLVSKKIYIELDWNGWCILYRRPNRTCWCKSKRDNILAYWRCTLVVYKTKTRKSKLFKFFYNFILG